MEQKLDNENMYMAEQRGAQVFATILWLLSADLGLIAVLQLYEATRVISALIMPIDPMQTVVSQGKVNLVSRVMLIVLAVTWLIGVIILPNFYLKIARKSVRHLLTRFLMITVIELATVGLATLVIHRLPGLVLEVG